MTVCCTYAGHKVRVDTDHPVAVDSVDHQFPRGAKYDNSTNPAFVAKLFALAGPVPSLLDLGCAGGALVRDVIEHGGVADGIEGSDYPWRNRLGEWQAIPDHLHTADITKPFTVIHVGEDGIQRPMQYDVVTMWEVLEHIERDDLDQVFDNVRRHLVPGGLLVVSVNTEPDSHDGHEYHATVESGMWWDDEIVSHAFEGDPVMTRQIHPDWVRNLPSSATGAYRMIG